MLAPPHRHHNRLALGRRSPAFVGKLHRIREKREPQCQQRQETDVSRILTSRILNSALEYVTKKIGTVMIFA